MNVITFVCRPMRPVIWLCFLAFVLTGCQNPTSLTGPSPVPNFAASATNDARGPAVTPPQKPTEKVKLCHRTGNGKYVPIEVSESAVGEHVEHGDLYPNGQLDSNCEPIPPAADPPPPPPPPPPPEPEPVPLSCGAPSSATYPGSATPPGTVVYAAAGVYFWYSVTAITGNTWVTREIIDTYATGPVTQQGSVLIPSNGTYAGYIFTSATLPFLREIRFTLNGASCSLFWNVNPS